MYVTRKKKKERKKEKEKKVCLVLLLQTAKAVFYWKKIDYKLLVEIDKIDV